MSLVKFIRKNNRKIMVFVVIFSMVSFVIGAAGIQLIVSLFGGGNQLIAVYDGGTKLKSRDFWQAERELTILRSLMSDQLLVAQGSSLTGPLLVTRLFPDSQFNSGIAAQLVQQAQGGRLDVSVEQIESFFSQKSERPEILWILLKAEAHRAGYVLGDDVARRTLQSVIPQLTGNQIDYTGLMSRLIRGNNVSEEQVLRIFADLMSVVSYAGSVMDNHAVTINQVQASLGRSKERFNSEHVKIDAVDLIDKEAEISDAELLAQFEAFKSILPNNPTEDNPFGFGYQQPKRVQLEYILVMMDDVKKQTVRPTAEAMEDYYSRNIARFTREVPVDPDKPDGEKVTKTQSFAEVESQIRRIITEERGTTLANQVFNEMKARLESGFETVNFEEATVGQLQMAAGDFDAVGKAMSEKYNFAVMTGKTGFLSADDFAEDVVLGNLGIQRQQRHISLTDMALAATLQRPERQRIGMPSIRVWESIGPLSGYFHSQESNQFGNVMALVRVVDIKEPHTPENLDSTFSRHGVTLFGEPQEAAVSMREQVKSDIQLLRAMDAARAKAVELAEAVQEKGWTDALAALNTDAEIDQVLKLDRMDQQLRMPRTDIEMVRRMMRENPSAAAYLSGHLTNGMLTSKLHGLLPEKDATTGTIQAVVAFEPQAAYYVVKEVVRQPATMDDYLENKAQTAFQLNAAMISDMALVHFGTEAILNRMNYESKLAETDVVQTPEAMPLPAGEII